MDRKIEKKKGLKRKHLYWGIGSVLFGFLCGKIILGSQVSTIRVDADKLVVSTVEEGIFSDYISVSGRVEPISIIYLDAEEGGRVSEIIIEEGAMVKKGDVILKLENRQLYQNILNSEASLAEKENYLRNTRISFETEIIQSRRSLLDNEYQLIRKKRMFEQNQQLYTDGLISKEEYLQSKENFEYELKLMEINKIKAKNDSIIKETSMITLERDLLQMRRMLKLVHERIDNLLVKATVDGQLGLLDAEIGQSITQGQRIGQINVLTNFKVSANIDEHYIDRVKRDLVGMLERNGKQFSLIVKKVYPEVRGGQFRVDLVFDSEKPENIRTGQTYYIKLELGESIGAIMISRGVFFQYTGGQWIYVLNDAGTEAVKQKIKIGRQNMKYYEVLEGLQPNQRVITSSYDSFGDCDRIIIRK